MKPVKKKHSCTAEIIAELEKLPYQPHPQPKKFARSCVPRQAIRARIKELKLKAKETQL